MRRRRYPVVLFKLGTPVAACNALDSSGAMHLIQAGLDATESPAKRASAPTVVSMC